jgi:hypothetical protein
MARVFAGAKKTFLASVADDDPVAEGLKKRLKNCLEGATTSLGDYLKTYDSFSSFLNLDLTEYVRSYEEKNLPIEDDKKEVELIRLKKEEVENSYGGGGGVYFVRVGSFARADVGEGAR